MLEFRQVTKTYPSSRGPVVALDQLTLSVPAGCFAAVIGPSGCGKSTLLSLAAGLALPTAGDVEVDGQLVSQLPPSGRAGFRAEKVGFVFQLFHLLPYLNIVDNVAVAATGNRSAARRQAEELLARFGMESRATHRPSQLSAGERQRVGMARALINGPKLLLADEPTGNLDPKNAETVLDDVCEFHRAGGTVLMVTHDDRAAERAERAIELKAGELVEA
ncbi:MAG: ABC transporter ATP-binding protein [Pirellulaceae bacterium]|jgi:ABC-type lipoprotein export system ATPase subunit|nr:ABC transporter ATP-binding protein [Pirellulaceae bacterium]MDP7020157.1 ABC transporter ATP-binding protein [Pirellulaceae bacterium]